MPWDCFHSHFVPGAQNGVEPYTSALSVHQAEAIAETQTGVRSAAVISFLRGWRCRYKLAQDNGDAELKMS